MASIDVTAFLEQCGIRHAKLGGLEPEDVRLAVQAFGAEYEKQMARLEQELRQQSTDNAALEKHCQALVTQNRVLTGQNVSLASSNEGYSRKSSEQDTMLSSLRTKNRSLNDNNARLVLRNHDLENENQRLRDEAERAKAELTVHGGELKKERATLAASRSDILHKSQQEAGQTLAAARAQAEEICDAARTQAAATQEAARTQAQALAQKMVDEANNEANEIHNIHQLRLNSLKKEVAQLESYRSQMVEYLSRMGRELLHAEDLAKEQDPAAVPQQVPGQLELELKPLKAPQIQLDLTPDAIARAAARMAQASLQSAGNPAAPSDAGAQMRQSKDTEQAETPVQEPRAQAAVHPAENPPDAPQTPAAPTPPAAVSTPLTPVHAGPEEAQQPDTRQAAPDLGGPETSERRDSLKEQDDLGNFENPESSLESDPLHHPQKLPDPPAEPVPGEVPGAPVGAIFSMPIINPNPEPLVEGPRPVRGPRSPVMPELAEEDEEDAAQPDAPAGGIPRSRVLAAVRALRRIQRQHPPLK
jgi:hypothetical protein